MLAKKDCHPSKPRLTSEKISTCKYVTHDSGTAERTQIIFLNRPGVAGGDGAITLDAGSGPTTPILGSITGRPRDTFVGAEVRPKDGAGLYGPLAFDVNCDIHSSTMLSGTALGEDLGGPGRTGSAVIRDRSRRSLTMLSGTTLGRVLGGSGWTGATVMRDRSSTPPPVMGNIGGRQSMLGAWL